MTSRRASLALRITLALGIAGLTVWAYRNSFAAPFIWDGVTVISGNPRIRALSLETLSGTSRPLVQLSFALNYAAGGLAVAGYHAVNLAIHVLAALALFALAARTFTTERLAPRFGARAPWLAAALAALWAVHPLQTESVTYVVQRSELLAGLFFVALLYAFVRAAQSPRPLAWQSAAVACMVLGVASKPVMAVAPLVVVLFDRCFLAGSLRACVARRGRFHATLFASAALLPLVLMGGTREWQSSTGFDLEVFTPGGYALTQLGVVAHYLRLAVWPAPLVLDYAWPQARGLADVLPGAAIVIPLVVLTLVGIARNHPLGFLGAWVFVILAPTSSVFPIQDAAFEHRMYLPLAAVSAFAVAMLGLVVGPGQVARRTSRDGGRPRAKRSERAAPPQPRRSTRAAWQAPAATMLVVLAAFALAYATARRNEDYRSAIAIWSDTVNKHPRNPRAHVFLGQALADAGRRGEAIAAMEVAVELNPNYGLALASLTRAREMANAIAPDEAARDYARALELNPDLPWTRAYYGVALMRANRPEDARRELTTVLEREPDLAIARYGRGVSLVMLGHIEEGRADLRRAVAAVPTMGSFNRALAWADSIAAATPGSP